MGEVVIIKHHPYRFPPESAEAVAFNDEFTREIKLESNATMSNLGSLNFIRIIVV